MSNIENEKIPHEKVIDNTLALKQEGYMFIKNRCDELQTDIFKTHLLGEEVICMTGEEAAKIFYDSNNFERKNAAPKRVQKTLFGENAIQGMDGEAHLHRKHLFMSLADKLNQDKLATLMMGKLMNSISVWENSQQIVLFDEAKNKLCQVACEWSGVPLADSEIEDRANDFAAMVDGFGGVGPRYWSGRKARTRTEDWVQGIISNVRLGKLHVQEDTALHTFAFYKDLNENMLDEKMAAIELINIIRPIVAISTYIAFMIVALHDNPNDRQFLIHGNDEYFEMFVQEVRRFFPFTPFVGARVKKDFNWNNCDFTKNTLVLLDVYGINHDSRTWDAPFTFQPERFKNWNGNMFTFIPQGGSDPATGHRCPGEGITTTIMKTTLDFLVNNIKYQFPDQDLNYSLSRIPTFPESKVILSNVKGLRI